MVRGQFSGGNCMGAIFLGCNYPRGQLSGGGNPQRGNYPGDNFPQGQLS